MASFRQHVSRDTTAKARKLDTVERNLVSVLLHQGKALASLMLQDLATHLSLEKMGNIMTALLSAGRAELAEIVLWKAPEVWDNVVKVRQVFGAMTSTPLWKKWIDTSEVKELTLGRFWSKDNIVVTDEWLHLVGSGEFPQLTSLKLMSCDNITDASVIQLADKCSQLTSLNLFGCRNITDASVIQLAHKCSHLTSLDLALCRNITDASVIQLALECSQLTSLNLNNCWRITDASVIQLAHKCSQLTTLNLSGCRNITDASVSQLACSTTQLTSLNLEDCHKITDASVIQLAHKCSHLTSLDLSDCDNITDTCIANLRQTYPQLVIDQSIDLIQ